MNQYANLPLVEQQVLRGLLNSNGHAATAQQLAGTTFFPDQEVLDATDIMHRRGLIEPSPDYSYAIEPIWRPAPPMLMNCFNCAKPPTPIFVKL